MDTYKYDPVDSSKYQIRLLKVFVDYDQIIGRKKLKPLAGSLTSHFLPVSSLSRKEQLSSAVKFPMYYALSYVWGDPTRTREILIDRKTLGITENLYQALRGMQREISKSFRVWADAICINQGDLDERSGQILLMRDLYHSAVTVRIYLGPCLENHLRVLKFISALTGAAVIYSTDPEEEDSVVDDVIARAIIVPGGVIAQSLHHFSNAIVKYADIAYPQTRDDRANLLLNPDENLSLHQESIEGISKWRPSEKRLKRAAYEGDFKEVTSLIAEVLLENEWFSRMWVVQELGAANSVSVQMGPLSIDWDGVVKAIYYVHFSCHIHLQHIRRVTGMAKIRLGWIKGDRQPLQELIRECQYRRATDPRDKVYSLFGMMGDKMNDFLKPDYTKSTGQVYANATRHFISQAESLDIICTWQVLGRSTDPSWDLPSWTPDYSLDQQRIASTLAPTDGRESIFAASGADHRSMFTFSSEEATGAWRELPVKGIIIDTIDVLSTSGDENQRLSEQEKDWLSAILLSATLTTGEQQALERISETVQYYCHGQKSVEESQHVKDTDLSVDSILGSSILSGYMYSILCGRIVTRERLQPNDVETLLSRKYPSASMAFDAFYAGIHLRRLVITKNGYIGAAPFSAKNGDLICVLYGCSVPVVLRPSTEDLSGKAYQFVGECYLHGFMDAEAIVWHIKGKLRESDFVLV